MKTLSMLEDRITKKILRYGEKHIQDEHNVIALELCYLVHREFEKFSRKISQKEEL